MRVRTTIAAVTAGLLLGTLAGCADPGDEQAAPEGDEPAVVIRGSAFEPQTLSVPVGTTVVFTNDDAFTHTVTAGTPGAESGEFDEPLASQGAEAEIVFDSPGTVTYFCRAHPSMTGTVEVGG